MTRPVGVKPTRGHRRICPNSFANPLASVGGRRSRRLRLSVSYGFDQCLAGVVVEDDGDLRGQVVGQIEKLLPRRDRHHHD